MLNVAIRLIVIVLAAAIGPGCINGPPACAVSAQATYGLVGNAGCMVERHGQMLAVRMRATGKLGVPGGAPQPGETARCTAHRETREEAGLEVTVGELLLRIPETDFYLFDCTPAGRVNPASSLDDLHTEVAGEIAEVLWIDPETIKPDEWRYPQGLTRVQEIFRQRRQHTLVD